MPRHVPDAQRADETVTVRVPRGTAAKVRAATGQNFSTIVRWMVLALLDNFAAQGQTGNAKEALRETIQTQINEHLHG